MGSGTYDEAATFLIEFLLRGCNTNVSRFDGDDLETNQVVHQGVADALGQTTKLIRALGALQELRDLPSLFQWDEFLKNTVKLSSRPLASQCIWTLEERWVTVWELPSSLLLRLHPQELVHSEIFPTLRLGASTTLLFCST